MAKQESLFFFDMFNPGSTIPFRGKPGIYKRDEPPGRRPEMIYEAKVRTFFLNREKDREALERALSMCANGRAVYLFQDRVYDEKEGAFKVLFGYMEMYYEPAEKVREKRLKLG